MFEDREAIRITADTSHGGDDSSRTKIDDPHRAARRSVWGETRPAGHRRVLSVRSDCGSFGIAREDGAVGFGRTNDRNTRDFGVRIMSQRSAKIDNRYVVRAIIRHDDLSPIGCPGNGEMSRLALWIVGSDLDPGHLGVRR